MSLDPPDLYFTDIKRLGFAPVRVIGADSHEIDRDGDGGAYEVVNNDRLPRAPRGSAIALGVSVDGDRICGIGRAP